uniref:Protein-glucosylgalactosylhydroxylysine glucosidase n=1 Tax=Denticeps clupeoides TaxID=299321 RepID=A0AAY4DWA3_9TELE
MTSESVDPYIFTSDSPPSDPRFLPPLANGLLGWRIFQDVMHVGGVYNGQGGDCHRANVPCPLAATVRMQEEGGHTYSLNTHTGVHRHSRTQLQQRCVSASQSFYAHRVHSNLLVMEVLLARQGTHEEPVTVWLDSSFTPQSDDIAFRTAPDYRGGRHIYGQTLVPEVPGGSCPSLHMIWTPLLTSLTLPPDQSRSSWTFLAAVSESDEGAKSCFDQGLQLMADGDLGPSHCRGWEELWLGCQVEVSGAERLNRAVIGCLFYLLSALPFLGQVPSQFWGVSPGGLSNGGRKEDYLGHAFWDQDTWMYPTIALFYPTLARAILQYRVQTLEGAKYNAMRQGYKGVKFSWESAMSGREVCPEDIYGQQEIHINGDVIQAFQLYLYLTQDLEFFKKGRGGEVVWGVADFWTSRVTWSSEEQSYHIKGVMPPDEYHYDVDNSVYTNAVAMNSLLFAVELAEQMHLSAPPEWKEVAEKLKLPFDPQLQYHPEFDGYKKGDGVKQADVVLLGYPLGLPMSAEVRRNDLEAYGPVTNPNGPAMTWSMFAVGWMELGKAEEAQTFLKRCFENIQAPFHVWSESSDGSGCVNFLTGMGGFLQAVVCGFTGFRVKRMCLTFDPILPDEISELSLKGVSYLGNKMTWQVKEKELSVTLWEQAKDAGKRCPLKVVLRSGRVIPLCPGQTVTFPRESGEVRLSFQVVQMVVQNRSTHCRIHSRQHALSF